MADQGKPYTNDTVNELAGKPIRLRFTLRDADLYAFQFGNDPTAQSD